MPITLKKDRDFIPDVFLTFTDDETGKESRINNRDLKENDQITCELSLAGAGEKSTYLDRVNETSIATQLISVVDKMDFNQACIDKCHLIKGLETFGITNGVSLVKHAPRRELNDLILQIYHKVCGTHTDDVDIPTPEKSKPSA